MDIKEKIEELVAKITKDKKLMENFKENPIEAVKALLDIDLSSDVLEKIVAGVKAKISVDKLSDAADLLKKLF